MTLETDLIDEKTELDTDLFNYDEEELDIEAPNAISAQMAADTAINATMTSLQIFSLPSDATFEVEDIEIYTISRSEKRTRTASELPPAKKRCLSTEVNEKPTEASLPLINRTNTQKNVSLLNGTLFNNSRPYTPTFTPVSCVGWGVNYKKLLENSIPQPLQPHFFNQSWLANASKLVSTIIMKSNKHTQVLMHYINRLIDIKDKDIPEKEKHRLMKRVYFRDSLSGFSTENICFSEIANESQLTLKDPNESILIIRNQTQLINSIIKSTFIEINVEAPLTFSLVKR